MEAGLEGSSLVKSTRYLIGIFFQGGTFCPNRPVFNLMIPYRLDTVQLAQEKEKSSVAQCSTGLLKKKFLECGSSLILGNYKRGPDLFFKYFYYSFGTGLFYPLRVPPKVQLFFGQFSGTIDPIASKNDSWL